VIARGKPDPFYKTKRADTKSSGAQRRSIPNLEALVGALSGISTNTSVAYLEEMTVVEKITLFRGVDIVIGQMGAGLNNALWMRPGSAMIEILSLDSIRPNFAVFANICHRMDVRHRRVVQESNHAPVNLDLITGFAKDLLATAPSC
jgi:capsular polysaccharide biosynthesis protein